jgi:hypothetical protein
MVHLKQRPTSPKYCRKLFNEEHSVTNFTALTLSVVSLFHQRSQIYLILSHNHHDVSSLPLGWSRAARDSTSTV